jgi:hypothetical protein
MTTFLLSAKDIHDSTNWGEHRIRTVLATPYPLTFSYEKPPAGGRPRRLFEYGSILARCRTKKNFTQEMANNLAQIVQQKIKDE